MASLRWRPTALDDTVVVFTSDNGFMQGEHRIPLGKVVGHEESIRVPLLVRGPGFPAGSVRRDLVSNVDLPRTLLGLAGARARLRLDGRSLLLAPRPSARGRQALLLETGPDMSNLNWPAYTGLRTNRYKYLEHATREVELYDLDNDPYELRSRHDGRLYAAVRERLAAELDDFAACSGRICRRLIDPLPPSRPRRPGR